MFDWGTGCGVQLGWLQQLFGVRTSGQELMRGDADVARAELDKLGPKKGLSEAVCGGDGRELWHVGDASVDHVISNGAMDRLNAKEQCDLVLDHFFRILKKGGSMWIGFGAGGRNENKANELKQCLRQFNQKTEDTPSSGGFISRMFGGTRRSAQAKKKIIFEVVDEIDFFGTAEYWYKSGTKSFSILAVKA